MTYIEIILKQLEKKGLKLVDLANKLGVSKSVVSSWKSRNTNPPLEYLVQICELLETTPNKLLGVNDSSEFESIYNRLSSDDKGTVDYIFSKYKELDVKSSASKIG